MSNTKTVMGQASNQYVAPTDITDVFSTYLYHGTSSAQTITNGIDLAGEGGLVWMKNRTHSSYPHALQHTTIANGGYLSSNDTSAFKAAVNNGISAFNSNGFTFDTGNWEEFNNSSHDYASWTFRKAPKFFTRLSYTGDSNATQTVNHDLGSVPGMIIIKKTDGTSHWAVYHRSAGSYRLRLNRTEAKDENGFWATSPTDTAFTLSNSDVKSDGATYVAYLFAHNDGDGGFGTDNSDIIKCGSFSSDANSGNTPVHVELGWEPQWLMYKSTSHSDNWVIFDAMRGWTNSTASGSDKELRANTSDADYGTVKGHPNATGFTAITQDYNRDYIYMAIRRGPLAAPTAGTEVFAPVIGSGVQSPGFPVDFLIGLNDRTSLQSYDPFVKTRLLGGAPYLVTSSTAVEASGTDVGFDTMDGLTYSWTSSSAVAWYWRRAPGFFDAVAYSGNGTAGRTVSHNLGVAPEMIWVKRRNSTGGEWQVYHSGLNGGTNPEQYAIELNSSGAEADQPRWNDTAPTDAVFSLGNSYRENSNGDNYIAYLFASTPGVSKVGSYTADGNAQNIDCGFTSGARFVLIKRTNTGGNWFVLDTVRGIVSGNDPLLELNSTGAEDNQYDNLDPYSAGFTVAAYNNNTSPYLNISGGTYIFYAIA